MIIEFFSNTQEVAQVDAGQLASADYLTREQILQVTISADELKKQYEKFGDIVPHVVMLKADAPQVGAGKPEKPTIKDTRILVGKYDELVLLWVNRPYIPKQTKDEFLSEHAGELGRKSFDRVLKDAYKRGIIGKDPGKHGRYKPKTVS